VFTKHIINLQATTKNEITFVPIFSPLQAIKDEEKVHSLSFCIFCRTSVTRKTTLIKRIKDGLRVPSMCPTPIFLKTAWMYSLLSLKYEFPKISMNNIIFLKKSVFMPIYWYLRDKLFKDSETLNILLKNKLSGSFVDLP
jgi:hypothetical protein